MSFEICVNKCHQNYPKLHMQHVIRLMLGCHLYNKKHDIVHFYLPFFPKKVIQNIMHCTMKSVMSFTLQLSQRNEMQF